MVNLPQQIKGLITITRPVHWIKNLAVFAALVFTGHLYETFPFKQTLAAFIAFCLVTSATYIINDILDAKVDAQHSIKKSRPIPAGLISPNLALLEAGILALLAVVLASLLGRLFSYVIWSYLAIQIFYSLILKNIAVLDILIIATGFILRVYSGALVINAHLSVWFLLCVISLALFLASGKRRAELNTAGEGAITRKSLKRYNKDLLNSFVTMFGNAAWVSWSLFTFFESPKASLDIWLFLAELSKTTTVNKLLMVTIPVVIYGIMRYQYLIFEDRSEAPEKILLTDRPLVLTVIIWTALVIWIFYGGVSV